MINYDWKCKKCSTANKAGSDACLSCGESAYISGDEIEGNHNAAQSKKQQLAHTHVVFLVCSMTLCIRSIHEGWKETAITYGIVFLITLFVFIPKFGSSIKNCSLGAIDYLGIILFMIAFLMILVTKIGYLWMLILGLPFYFFTKKVSLKIASRV
ncbi:hypothetical protein [Neptuniibacter sp. QD37_11]|uniref:hypothetical protein n=1 Tax=Neptuniibacter sp. QD37_11 TaxID=3398209 RepID=UPI0039F4BDD5